jgi:hypothetical protein
LRIGSLPICFRTVPPLRELNHYLTPSKVPLDNPSFNCGPREKPLGQGAFA